jgi:hypothetical protein
MKNFVNQWLHSRKWCLYPRIDRRGYLGRHRRRDPNFPSALYLTHRPILPVYTLVAWCRVDSPLAHSVPTAVHAGLTIVPDTNSARARVFHGHSDS